MRLLPLFLLLIGWLVAGWFAKPFFGCCGVPAAAAVAAEPVKKAVAAAPVVTKPVVTKKIGINIADRVKSFSAVDADNLRFGKSEFQYKNRPLSSGLKTVFGDASSHLKKNPERAIVLTGLYTKDEKNPSALSNLGLARANNVKKILTGMGVSSAQILTDSKLIASHKFDGADVLGGMNYSFKDLPKKDDRLAKIEKTLKAAPKVLYFQTGKNEIKMDASLRQYFSDLMYYLDRKPKASVTSTGHTDSRGKRDSNVKLSKDRADFVREYLTKNGANAKQIRTNGMGPDKPLATNNSVEGRQKNRRVEITIN